MKKLTLIIALFLVIVFSAVIYADSGYNTIITGKSLDLKITNSQIAMGLKFDSKYDLSSRLGIGIASLDSDFKYNDYMVDLSLSYLLYEKGRSNFYVGSDGGIGIISDPTHNITVPYIGFFAGYGIKLGENRRSAITMEIGYVYGTKEYKKSYSAEWGRVSYIGSFEHNPMSFALGYSYYFGE